MTLISTLQTYASPYERFVITLHLRLVTLDQFHVAGAFSSFVMSIQSDQLAVVSAKIL